jgi:crossover junction endodeoxyribonuclease RuvC
MRIIGLDPGIAISGYGVLDFDESKNCFELITSGSIQTSKKLSTPQRLSELHSDIAELIRLYQPDCAVVEKIFYFKNAKTIIPVSEARGVITMTFSKHNVEIAEYTPQQVKQVITGYGRADKNEVADMVKIILNTDCIPKLDDTVDAIALSICHIRNIRITAEAR